MQLRNLNLKNQIWDKYQFTFSKCSAVLVHWARLLHQVQLVDGASGTIGAFDVSNTGEEDVANGVFLGLHTHLFFRDLGDEVEDDAFSEDNTIACCLGGWFFHYPGQSFLSLSFFMNAFMKVMRLSFLGGCTGVFCWIEACALGLPWFLLHLLTPWLWLEGAL